MPCDALCRTLEKGFDVGVPSYACSKSAIAISAGYWLTAGTHLGTPLPVRLGTLVEKVVPALAQKAEQLPLRSHAVTRLHDRVPFPCAYPILTHPRIAHAESC